MESRYNRIGWGVGGQCGPSRVLRQKVRGTVGARGGRTAEHGGQGGGRGQLPDGSY